MRRRRLLTFSIATVLLAFFSVPLGFIFYGAGAAAIGGWAIMGALIALQFPLFLVLKRMGALSPVDQDDRGS